jgi:hypothetical protein
MILHSSQWIAYVIINNKTNKIAFVGAIKNGGLLQSRLSTYTYSKPINKDDYNIQVIKQGFVDADELYFYKGYMIDILKGLNKYEGI